MRTDQGLWLIVLTFCPAADCAHVANHDIFHITLPCEHVACLPYALAAAFGSGPHSFLFFDCSNYQSCWLSVEACTYRAEDLFEVNVAPSATSAMPLFDFCFRSNAQSGQRPYLIQKLTSPFSIIFPSPFSCRPGLSYRIQIYLRGWPPPLSPSTASFPWSEPGSRFRLNRPFKPQPARDQNSHQALVTRARREVIRV